MPPRTIKVYLPNQICYRKHKGHPEYFLINGQLVGYSQDSKMTAEFDVSDSLQSGTNLVVVRVYRWCDGSYLEDQDQWWLSGIFRDVYLYRKRASHICDYSVQTECCDWQSGTCTLWALPTYQRYPVSGLLCLLPALSLAFDIPRPRVEREHQCDIAFAPFANVK